MSETRTVLGHLATFMASSPENLATEALAFIVNHSRSAREALHRQAAAVVGDFPAIGRVSTQAAVSSESRPDIILNGEDGRPVGYVEVKFWAGFTDAQPVEYVKTLRQSGGGVLAILAPERRRASARSHVIDRLREADLLTDVSEALIAAGTVRVGVLTWTDIISALRAAVTGDPTTSNDVAQLEGLVARFETEGFLPLLRADLDDLDVPRLVLRLADLAQVIVDEGARAGVLDRGGVRATHYSYGSGRYARLRSLDCWLGLNHAIWVARGRTPIWLCFEGRSADPLRIPLRRWLSADPPLAYLDDQGIQIPLLLPPGVEKEGVVAAAVSQLRELDAELTRSGFASTADSVPTAT